MRKWFKRAAGALALAILSYAALAYFFTPYARILAAFNQYKQSQVAGDCTLEASVISSDLLDFFDRQRQAALTAEKSALTSQPFMERSMTLALRNAVHKGQMSIADFRQGDSRAFFISARKAIGQPAPSARHWSLFAVLPTGPGHAIGVLDPAGEGLFSPVTWIALLFGPTRFDFKRVEGRWLIDPTRAMRHSAREHEYYERAMDATGENYLAHWLKIADPAQLDALWKPLQQDGVRQ